jgi:transcription elongation factor SPT5
VVLALMRRYFEKEYSDQPLEIKSAFSRDTLKGYIYVEAMRQAHVQKVTLRVSLLTSIQINSLKAIDKLSFVYGSKLTLVPISEMVDVMKVTGKSKSASAAVDAETLKSGAWVRVTRGKYNGDLAQVGIFFVRPVFVFLTVVGPRRV